MYSSCEHTGHHKKTTTPCFQSSHNVCILVSKVHTPYLHLVQEKLAKIDQSEMDSRRTENMMPLIQTHISDW